MPPPPPARGHGPSLKVAAERQLRLWPGVPSSRDPEQEVRPRKGFGPVAPALLAAARASSARTLGCRWPGTDRGAAEGCAAAGGWTPRPTTGRRPGRSQRDLPAGERPLPTPPCPSLQQSGRKCTLGRPPAARSATQGAQRAVTNFPSANQGRNGTQRIGFLFCCLIGRLRLPQLLLLGVTCHDFVVCSLWPPGLERSACLLLLSSNKSNPEQGC